MPNSNRKPKDKTKKKTPIQDSLDRLNPDRQSLFEGAVSALKTMTQDKKKKK